MKKIIMSVLAIAMAVGVVSSAAYALFSSTVSVAGITMTSGSANLGVYDRTGDTYTSITNSDVKSMFSQKLTGMYPGFKDYTELWFNNESTSKFGLSLTAHISGADGDLSALGDNVLFAFNTTGNTWNFPTTGWYTLNDLVNNQIPVGTLIEGNLVPTEYKMFIKIDPSIGNEMALKHLTANIEFTGTQIAK